MVISELETKVEQLTRERNHFAQKLVALQSDPVQSQKKVVTRGEQFTSQTKNGNARLNPFFIESESRPALPPADISL